MENADIVEVGKKIRFAVVKLESTPASKIRDELRSGYEQAWQMAVQTKNLEALIKAGDGLSGTANSKIISGALESNMDPKELVELHSVFADKDVQDIRIMGQLLPEIPDKAGYVGVVILTKRGKIFDSEQDFPDNRFLVKFPSGSEVLDPQEPELSSVVDRSTLIYCDARDVPCVDVKLEELKQQFADEGKIKEVNGVELRYGYIPYKGVTESVMAVESKVSPYDKGNVREAHMRSTEDYLGAAAGGGFSNIRRIRIPESVLKGQGDEDIKEVAKPVVQRARLEAARKREEIAKRSNKELSEAEMELLSRYDRVVERALNNGWMTLAEIDYKLPQQEAKVLVQEAVQLVEVLPQDLDTEIVHNERMLSVKRQLELLAMKLKQNWETVALNAGANPKVIEVMRGL